MLFTPATVDRDGDAEPIDRQRQFYSLAGATRFLVEQMTEDFAKIKQVGTYTILVDLRDYCPFCDEVILETEPTAIVKMYPIGLLEPLEAEKWHAAHLEAIPEDHHIEVKDGITHLIFE